MVCCFVIWYVSHEYELFSKFFSILSTLKKLQACFVSLSEMFRIQYDIKENIGVILHYSEECCI